MQLSFGQFVPPESWHDEFRNSLLRPGLTAIPPLRGCFVQGSMVFTPPRILIRGCDTASRSCWVGITTQATRTGLSRS